MLDYDGGLVDASGIAVMSALQDYKRPDVSVEGEEVRIYSSAERVPVPLSILHHPLCVTLSFFHGGDVVVVDATILEQQLSEGEMIVTANKHGEICQIAKSGGVPTDALALLNCVETALTKTREIHQIIMSALERHNKDNDLGGITAELSAENER